MVYIAWRLPPKAAMPEHGAGVVEANRNGGLDLLKTAVSAMWVCMGNDLPASGFFLFPAGRQMFRLIQTKFYRQKQ